MVVDNNLLLLNRWTSKDEYKRNCKVNMIYILRKNYFDPSAAT